VSDEKERIDFLEDAELARRISAAGWSVAGCEEAELCRRYARRLYLFGLRHLGSQDRARDLAQDALVVTLQKLRTGEVRELDRIGSFVLGVARLLSHSANRDRARFLSMDSADSPATVAEAPQLEPLQREEVAHCLESLEARQRSILVLTYYSEQSTSEIAISLGLTRENVRVIRHRGMAQLRTCLGLDAEGGMG